jgi:hypothetical protein
VTMDDAMNTIYSGFLLAEEGTASTFQALLEVFGRHGLSLNPYTDRGSHYFHTPQGWWPGRSQVSGPGWACAGAVGCGAHRGLFPRGPRSVGTSVRRTGW